MKKHLRDVDFNGKRVLMRVDYNVPYREGRIVDNSRIVSSLESIRYILKRGGKLILISHFGRPGGEVVEKYSLKPCAAELGFLLKNEARVLMATDLVGNKVENMIAKADQKDIVILENCRFYPEETEQNNKEARLAHAKQLAKLADVYVNDAFGASHRDHVSIVDVAQLLPSAAGLLMEKEILFLSTTILNPKRPLIVLLGGAKVSDKLPLIENFLGRADRVMVGGGMAYTFLKAMDLEIGTSLLEKDLIPDCKRILKKAKEKLVLPLDNMIGVMDFEKMSLEGKLDCVPTDKFPTDKQGLDIGEQTIALFRNIILEAKTLLWNGPMGVFECMETARGTFLMGHAFSEATMKGATTIVGGGDSAASIHQLGLRSRISHVSTGGGAAVKVLEGNTLVGIAALDDK